MDLPTLEAIGTLVKDIGLPATLGLIAVFAAWNLIPVLAAYLRAKIAVNQATAIKTHAQLLKPFEPTERQPPTPTL